MRINLRKFNKKGLSEYISFLDNIRFHGSDEDPPFHLLSDPQYSEKLILSDGRKIRIKTDQDFENQIDFGDYLLSIFRTEEDLSQVLDDEKGGSWLGLAFFNSICKRRKDKTWRVKELARYRLDLEGRQKLYRHLVCGVLATYSIHRERSRLFLYGPLHQHARTLDVVGSAEELMLNPRLVEVLDLLYWDVDKKKPKPRTTSNKRPLDEGVLYRFIGPGSFIKQFEQTFDFWTMSCEEILELLPAEFDKWIDN